MAIGFCPVCREVFAVTTQQEGMDEVKMMGPHEGKNTSERCPGVGQPAMDSYDPEGLGDEDQPRNLEERVSKSKATREDIRFFLSGPLDALSEYDP